MDNLNQTTQVLIKQITDKFLDDLTNQIKSQVSNYIANELTRIDVPNAVREFIQKSLTPDKSIYNFPDRSISGKAIDPNGLFLRADQIAGGTFTKFESTGIQDQATDCRVTILDKATVFENQLVAKTLQVAGDAVINGNLTLTGSIPKESKLFADISTHALNALTQDIETGVLSGMKNKIVDDLRHQGIDVSVVKVDGARLVKDNTLAASVVFSNLQKVGALRELQVVGESLFDETVYISNRRVGVNTIDPEHTVDIWDQEIQITMGKLSNNRGYLSLPKAQELVIGTNQKENIVCEPDGSVSVTTLNLGRITHSTANSLPAEVKPRGYIYWNTEPEIGGPIGWVSLGGARWAKFGEILV